MANTGKWKFPKQIENWVSLEEHERSIELYGYSFWHKLTCWHCGETFIAKCISRRYCSYRCRNDASIERRRAYRKLARKKICGYCGKEFQARRRDAKFCCGSHRVLACLKRKREMLEKVIGTVSKSEEPMAIKVVT